MFTVGSKYEKADVGAGIVTSYWGIHKAYKLTEHPSVCTAELAGILKALELVVKKNRHSKNAF